MQNDSLEQLRRQFEKLTPEFIESMSPEGRAELQEQIEVYRKLSATENYIDYCAYVHGNRWKECRHQTYICNQIDSFVEEVTGNPYDILILTMGPQHGKSMSVTETLPSFYLGKHKLHRVIMASYNDDLANRFGRRNRDKLKQYGFELFNVRLAKIPNSDSNFELDNKIGGCISRGIRSGITGNPAELIIIDDPVKNKEEADSLRFRDKVWDEWVHALRTRLAPGAKVIVILTRWHEDDIAGRMIETERLVEDGGVVRVINLPCEAEENDPLGREPGEPLAPELGRDRDWMLGVKGQYMSGSETGGPSAWYALYQGRPKILEGNMFKEGWFNFWYPREIKSPGPVSVIMPDGSRGQKEPVARPLQFDELLQSWDCTFKDEMNSDYVVGTLWGRDGIDYYLLDMVRRRMNVVETIESIELLSRKWPNARLKLVEDKANGPAVIQLLRNKVSGLVPIPAIKSKAGRAQATEAAFESGHVFIPHPHVYRWAMEVINEFTSFPNGLHDDIVDSCVHALNRFEQGTANSTRLDGKLVKEVLGWRPMNQQGPIRRVAKGRARVI